VDGVGDDSREQRSRQQLPSGITPLARRPPSRSDQEEERCEREQRPNDAGFGEKLKRDAVGLLDAEGVPAVEEVDDCERSCPPAADGSVSERRRSLLPPHPAILRISGEKVTGV
jgi:hypothetical protein